MNRSIVAAVVTVTTSILAPAVMASGVYQAAGFGYAPEGGMLLAQSMTEQEGGMETTAHEHEAASGADDVAGSGDAPVSQRSEAQMEVEGEAPTTGPAPAGTMGGGMARPGAMGGGSRMGRMMHGGSGMRGGGHGMMQGGGGMKGGMRGRHEDVVARLERIERRQIIIETMLRELLLGR